MRFFPPPKGRLGEDYSTAVVKWMGRCAFRYVHELDRAGTARPNVEDLTDWIHEAAQARISYIDDEQGRAKLARQAGDAAEFVLAQYDPNAIQYVRARHGGAKSRRRSPHLGALAELDHLGPTAAGRELGIGPEQVRRLRKQRKAMAAAAELDELIPPAPAPEPAQAPAPPPSGSHVSGNKTSREYAEEFAVYAASA